ncbi:MAG: hypothetical protein FWC50_06500 [Planctomycetaceae bacterium]|nr:hypothetical protein [Planctomycetaceae bacterium]
MNDDKEIPKVTTYQLVSRYTRALSRWIKAGRPVRAEAEILRIYDDHCQPCEAIDETTSSCRHCGCRVNTSTIAPLNKIAMQTENCPIQKW